MNREFGFDIFSFFLKSKLHEVFNTDMDIFCICIVVQIFLDMAVLVDAQGEMLDNIESQVCINCEILLYFLLGFLLLSSLKIKLS